MMYLLDTVALIRHFAGNRNIGHSAKKILDSFAETDYYLAVSIISLMEIMYLSEKKRINIDLVRTIKLLTENDAYKIIELNTEIIIVASNIDFYELHDRMILATAKWLDVPILSSDRKFIDVPDISVIWD